MIDCSKTENYFAEKRRMTKRTKNGICKTKCSDCPLCSENNGISENLSCTNFEMHYPEKAIEIIQKWSNEHPQKTYLTELLKNYPNAKLGENGVPMNMCPSILGLQDLENCGEISCVECWNQPVKESEKNG
mgnify:CR=1 FL=1|jgi:hypothetical protein|nr:hypothetical protein [Ruminococcus bromii]